MKIIVDNKIPYIQKAIERIADEVVYIPGKDFTPELVRDADALIIRTRTHCNRELLEGSQVKFIELLPSASITSIRNTAGKPASHGPMLRDVTLPP